MERAGPGRAGGARRGRGQRRPPTWEISDSDAEGSAGAETPARARESAGERRPVAEALQRLRPGQAVRRLAVLVDPAVLEDAGADTLMEALHALGCEPRAEPPLEPSESRPLPARCECPGGGGRVQPGVGCCTWQSCSERHLSQSSKQNGGRERAVQGWDPEPEGRTALRDRPSPPIQGCGRRRSRLALWVGVSRAGGEQSGENLCEPRHSWGPGLWPGVGSSTAYVPQVPPEVWAEDEPHVLLLLEPEEFVQGVGQLTQVCGPTCSIPWVTPESLVCLHLAVIGLDAYLWSQQPSTQETWQPERPAVTRAEAAVGWPEVEEALVRLQLWANVDVLLVASWQELSQHVCAFTKALTQRPFKQARESGAFPFCTFGRWAAGERVARDGAGLRGVWWRQVRQFNRVSLAVADAVVSAFPSPRLLQQAYVACGTEQERLALLADLPVKTGKGALPRRVGPDLSRRICLFLTTTDPDLLLDLGS